MCNYVKFQGINVEMSTINFNIGVLGHIDSGKTSLAKALSTISSTAAFDKNPQSRERGITLDLGFSSFSIPTPSHLSSSGHKQIQFTLVDCPGHASLIRTIIGGAQIIDMMLLVVDATKGMQTQTAECLVIGEVVCPFMIIVLNKIDLLPGATRSAQIDKLTKKFSRTIEQTRLSGAPIVPVAALPGGADSASSSVGIDKLIEVLSAHLFLPVRNPHGPFLFSVDHCFAIRGQGTVLTGTVLSGSVAVNEGDRLGICVTQFDPHLVERCLVASPGYLHATYAVVIKVFKIRYYKSDCSTGAKFHVTTGHETVMAKVTFFCSQKSTTDISIFEQEFMYQDSLPEMSQSNALQASATPVTECYALLEFERAIICPPDSKVIGSRLDNDAFSNKCRIAFYGALVESFAQKDYESSILPRVKIFKLKKREGLVDRVHDERTLIGKSLFKKETNIELFLSMKVKLSTGEHGVIDGTFGTSGKFRVTIPDGLSPETMQVLKKPKHVSVAAPAAEGTTRSVTIILEFKRYIFDPCKRMIQ